MSVSPTTAPRIHVTTTLIAVALLMVTVDAATPVGPERGTVFVHGGGVVSGEQWARFVELAGGAEAEIVVIPTAGDAASYDENWVGLRGLKDAGAKRLTLLHTRDRDEADSKSFVEPLTRAGGVWIGGGRQWRLADVFLDTRTAAELRRVLERGGVVGGSSAGATICGSYLVRGSPVTNQIMMSPGHERGFALLRDVAIDQHCIARHRELDMQAVVAKHAELLGIGLDERAALVVHGNQATVLGPGRVVITGAGGTEGQPYRLLEPGDTFDLAARKTLAAAASP